MARREGLRHGGRLTSSIQGIIFDLDGTLMDAYRPVAESLNFALTRFGFPAAGPRLIKRRVGWGDRHLIAQFVGEEKADAVLDVYRRHHRQTLPASARTLPGARRLLSRLNKQGFRLGIGSNRPSEFTRAALEALGLMPFFSAVVCADEVKKGKPAPDILRKILGLWRLRPRQVVYVGDMTIDIEAGQRAGLWTVGVATGSSSEADLEKAGAWRLIPRISALERIVGEEAGEG